MKMLRVVIPNTLLNDTKIRENFSKNLVFGFFTPLTCSHDFLSMIFGIFGKFRIDIVKKYFVKICFQNGKKSDQKTKKIFFEIKKI